MSCPAANSIVRMDVTMGSLPDGFCPATLKELAEAIAARLIVTPNQANSSFASGPIEPSSNQGPWFKNCEELFIFDDATARYVPILKGGFNTNEVFEISSSFTVPDNIFMLMVEAWGGGGGGANSAGGNSGGGGGAGGYGLQFFPVTPSQVFTVTVGVGGANGASGIAGGATTFSTMTANGGAGSAADTGIAWSDGGIGGTTTGAKFGSTGSAGQGGSSGTGVGWGGAAANGGSGGQPHLTASGGAAIMNGIAPGGGGGGGVHAGLTGGLLPASGGTGGNGRVVIWY